MSDESLRIGQRHIVPDRDGQEVEGVLVDAAVLGTEASAYGIYRLNDGRHITCSAPLNEAELRQYEQDPDNFFGAYRPAAREPWNLEECKNVLLETYGQSSKRKLLEFMASDRDIDQFRALSQGELAAVYCEYLAVAMMKSIEKQIARNR